MKGLTGSTATEIILAAELADYDTQEPTQEPTDLDLFILHALGVDWYGEDNREEAS
jgi:hypothetical protein